MQLGDFDPHLNAQRGVEVRQRLVEQEDLRVAHDGAADGDALALAAGKLAGLAIEQRLELQDRRRGEHLAFAVRPCGRRPAAARSPCCRRRVMCGYSA